MMTRIYESDLEEHAIELLEEQGYKYLSVEEQEVERSPTDVLLKRRVEKAIDKLNPEIPDPAKTDAIRHLYNFSSQDLAENNQAFHHFLTDGISVEYQDGSETIGNKVWLMGFEHPLNNDLIICNQVAVREQSKSKRPDLVLYINGLPLVVIELKNPNDQQATVKKAFTQLQNYKNAIPSLFQYNGVLVASDGLDARAGSLTSSWPRFMAWRTVDGIRAEKATIPQIETLIKGMLKPSVLLDLIKQFTVFEQIKKEHHGLTRIEIIKKIANDHQYHAVNKAIASTQRASATNGNRKIGVVWHTQGSGKSLSMVFYVGKIVLKLNNPTIVVVTDRNDLDDQLFDTFVSCQQILRQEPKQASNREHLKALLQVAGGGIVFTTIQKFHPEDTRHQFDLLSQRKNIVVIADEAHRSHYGFKAKTVTKEDGVITRYGFAKYLRDALPNASFIGFTGTPIEKENISTRNVFGDEIDIYDMEQACKDGATVPIHYESRLIRIDLDKDENLDKEFEDIIETEELTASERAKAKWTRVEALIGQKDRLKQVAKDIVEHFQARCEVFEGKGMIVTMSRRIAVELYEEIIKLCPDWHDTDQHKGTIKVIMTSSSSDPEKWQAHHTTKPERKSLGERFKDPSDSLRLVIVRDMWLTGFDVPCLHTMYIDKLMQGHNIMQTIARVNRVYKDKPGGLIVDYVGIASNLKKALQIYKGSGGKGDLTLDQSKAIETMMEKYEIVVQMFKGFDYQKYFKADTREKMIIILEAQEHILSLEDGKKRFIKNVVLLSKSFVLSVPSLPAMRIKDDVGFFQAIKARLVKFESMAKGRSDEEIETAIRQIIDQALVVEGVVDIFDVAGIQKPDLSILSDEFLEEVKGMKRKNLAVELLKKILNDQIQIRAGRNFIRNKKFSEMLKSAIIKYQNNLLTTAQIIEELIKIAKDLRVGDKNPATLGLTEAELAFYDALAMNESAKDVLGHKILRDLACILVGKVKQNASIDWTIKHTVQAQLRVIVKRTLRQYGYPPDQQKLATDNILKQAELFADEWSKEA